MNMSTSHFQTIQNVCFPQGGSTKVSLPLIPKKVAGVCISNLPTASDGSDEILPIWSDLTKKTEL